MTDKSLEVPNITLCKTESFESKKITRTDKRLATSTSCTVNLSPQSPCPPTLTPLQLQITSNKISYYLVSAFFHLIAHNNTLIILLLIPNAPSPAGKILPILLSDVDTQLYTWLGQLGLSFMSDRIYMQATPVCYHICYISIIGMLALVTHFGKISSLSNICHQQANKESFRLTHILDRYDKYLMYLM